MDLKKLWAWQSKFDLLVIYFTGMVTKEHKEKNFFIYFVANFLIFIEQRRLTVKIPLLENIPFIKE